MIFPLADTTTLPDIVIVLGVMALTMMVPIVAIFLKHQQKMATLYRSQTQNVQADERVLKEIAELRQIIIQQSLAIENLRREQLPSPQGESVQNRLGV
jgi:hypothetical protein